MDKIIGIEVDGYGITLDSYWAYVALSWQLLATATVLLVAYKVWKNRK